MTPEQIDYMTKSGLLFLDKKRRHSHFDAANTLKFTAFIPIVLFVVFIIKDGFDKLGTLAIVCTVMAAVLLLASYLTYKSQQSKLKLATFETGISKTDNYILTKKTLEILQWKIKEDTSDFIEAYNPHRDIRTWGNEMISIILLGNQILLNSICNLDTLNQSGFSFGKNQENVDIFITKFQVIRQDEKLQSPS